jgi:hypothetical protein
MNIIYLINENSGFVAGITALIMLLAVLAAFRSNHQARKQYTDSRKPELSMRLCKHGHYLCLIIQNTGAMLAKDIMIEISKIENNGKFDTVSKVEQISDLKQYENKLALFKALNNYLIDELLRPHTAFDLYPQEMSHVLITLWGVSDTSNDRPSVEVQVRYKISSRKSVQYQRKITHTMAYDFNSFTIESNNVELTRVKDGLYRINESIGWLVDSLDNSSTKIEEQLYSLSSLDNLDDLDYLASRKRKKKQRQNEFLSPELASKTMEVQTSKDEVTEL